MRIDIMIISVAGTGYVGLSNAIILVAKTISSCY